MQFDDIEWSVAAEDVFYAPVSGRTYKVVSVGVAHDGSLVVTYTRLAGNGVCLVMDVDVFKDGRFIRLQGWQLEQAVHKYVTAIKNAANEENV